MGVIKEKITKDIQAQRSEGIVNSSKIDQAFAKYDLNVDEEEVRNKVKSIITDKVPENDNPRMKSSSCSSETSPMANSFSASLRMRESH